MGTAHPLIALVLGLCVALAQAHPNHTSFAEVDWSEDRSSLEVSLRVIPEDLEQALAFISGAPVNLQQPDIDTLLAAYLQRHFQVADPQGSVAPVTLVGTSVQYRQTWLYFTLAAPAEQPLSLTNTLLLDTVEGQVNQVRPLWQAESLIFNAETSTQPLWRP
ncbi:DUF6702 family protein [Halioglobus pacificus]|uniref:Orphan protein n=1 Tax=Parahalioglobus pacificus TaxID=930806 RepID=A0A918XG95_9GAMM|nr:DUF6702 family protein [Halioglobus pacificus]NQY02375.1 hypothetical protein [Halieaceae bacterium]GHD29455.1 hypothetical protein GCM10007053_10010 [Halioglobus pacificus]